MATTAEALERLAEASDAQTRVLERIDRRERERGEGADLERRLRRRKEPRRLDAALMFQAVPAIAAAFQREVPGEFWAQTSATEAEVSCVCGQVPVCELEQLTDCECERTFLYTGRSVHVANNHEQSLDEEALVD